MQIIMEANDVCGLRQIEKEKVNKYINDYQDNEYISELKNQWDKKHNELEGGVKIKFEALLHKINTVKKINTIRELSEQFSKENTCSDLLVNLEKHAKLRIDAIKKLISSDYELLAKEINDVSNIDQLRSIQKKIDKFIKDYPDNQHISNLESVLKQKKSLLQVILRSSYSKLSVKEVRKMLNITIKEKKPNGFVGYSTIQHYYAVKMISGDQVALDHVTGLMWHMFGSDERMSHKKAEKWVQDLNNRGYAGYNDWRLPTVEEAASLLEFEKNNEDLFLGLRLGRFQPNIWTGDRHTYGGVWHVNFLKCTVGWITPYQKIYVCPVRVCK